MDSIKVMHLKLVLSFFICLSRFLYVSGCSGCVQLTDYTFDKLISKFDATIVKFDVAFPYGDKHEIYSSLAKDAKPADELLFAEVGVKDYGEMDNSELAKRFGIKKDDYPAVRMFLKHRKEPIPFYDDMKFTTENLRRFIKKTSGIHLSLPGCVPELDNIALRFSQADIEKKATLLKKAENIAAVMSNQLKSSAKIYLSVMQKLIEKGSSFITQENQRVNKLLSSKISADKKKELNNKINILQSFDAPSIESKKDEF